MLWCYILQTFKLLLSYRAHKIRVYKNQQLLYDGIFISISMDVFLTVFLLNLFSSVGLNQILDQLNNMKWLVLKKYLMNTKNIIGLYN